MTEKTTADWVREALEAEKVGAWRNASDAWGAAARAANGDAALSGRAALVPGAVLEHKRRGKVLASCTYVGPGKFVYAGTEYETAARAASAAAVALGMNPRKVNAWWFWGVEKREERYR